MKCIRLTDYRQLDRIVTLINAAYRGTTGQGRWTSEAHLIQGDRIRAEALSHMILNNHMALYVGLLDERIISCIALKQIGHITEFGTFAVEPELQGLGYGKALLDFAEHIASAYSHLFQVVVVSQNTDLIHFYKRRGYVETGVKLPYPVDQHVGDPVISNIDLTVMQKHV